MKIGNVKIVTRKNLCEESYAVSKAVKDKPWRLLFIKVFQRDDNGVWFEWICPFTPWRLFAAFFVKDSKYYQARVES